MSSVNIITNAIIWLAFDKHFWNSFHLCLYWNDNKRYI